MRDWLAQVFLLFPDYGTLCACRARETLEFPRLDETELELPRLSRNAYGNAVAGTLCLYLQLRTLDLSVTRPLPGYHM